MSSDLLAELVGLPHDWAPSLSPDGSEVAFLSDRGGHPQIWIAPVSGGEARLVPLTEDPVTAVRWSADGAWLAASVAYGGGVRTQVWAVRVDGSDPRLLSGAPERHGVLGPWVHHECRVVVGLPPDGPEELARAVLVSPVTGAAEEIAIGGLVSVLDISPDASIVLLRDGTRGRHYCVTLDRSADKHFPTLPYPDTGTTETGLLRPGPDGQGLVAYLQTDAGLPRTELVAVPVDPTGHRSPGGSIAHRNDAELEFLGSDDTGSVLVLGWNVAGRSELEVLDPTTGARRAITGLPGEVAAGLTVARDGSAAVVAVEGPAAPSRLWWVDLTSMQARPLGAPLPDVDVPDPSLEQFVSHDGLPISGWLYLPPGRTGPGPAVLHFHGGPEAQERPTWNPIFGGLLAAGIAVFAPNIRGSSGYGRAFVHADDRYGRWDGIGDVASCVHHLIDTGVAPAGQVGITGRSYGCYLTFACLVSWPDLFAGGVAVCGMSDLLTFFRDTEPWIAASSVSKYGDPETDAGLLSDLSPMHRVDSLAVPLVAVHGDLDTNVPYTESVQMVEAARALGKDARLVTVTGEGHEYRRHESKVLVARTIRDFFAELFASSDRHLVG